LCGRENLWNLYQYDIPNKSIDTYYANPYSKCLCKRIEYIDRWAKPSPQSLVTATRFLEMADLVLKDCQNGRGRVTKVELFGERMSRKILLGLYFVGLEGFVEDDIEIGRGCRCCGSLGARSGRQAHVEEMVVTLQKIARLESAGVFGHRVIGACLGSCLCHARFGNTNSHKQVAALWGQIPELRTGK
jgi:hypothetical protein